MVRTIDLLGLSLILAAIASVATASDEADLPPILGGGGTSPSGVLTSNLKNPLGKIGPMAKAKAALEAGDAKRALKLLKSRSVRIGKADRRSIEGRAYFLLNDYVTARRKLRAAVRLRPRQASDWFWLGRVYEAAGSHARAASSYEKAHWHGMDSTELRYHWANALRASGRILGDISQKQRRQGDQSPSVGSFAFDGVVLSLVKSRPGRFVVAPKDSALYQIHKALELGPDHGDSLFLAGELWAAADRHDKAVEFFERAETRLQGEDQARCHNRWAQSSLQLADFDSYLKHTRKYMQGTGGVDNEKFANCYERAAREAAGRGDLQREIRYLTFAVELKPEVDRLLSLADALLMAQRTLDAPRYLQQALEMNPTKKQRRAIQQRLMYTPTLASPSNKR
ncbi:MAG: tetratricopeptide repeat protein [Phycisphaerales bacterium]|nr:tetratricopeptide repeat protein [Phycisphaerales bacterium]